MEYLLHGVVWGWCGALRALPTSAPFLSRPGLLAVTFIVLLAATAAGTGYAIDGADGAGWGIAGFVLGVVAFAWWRGLIVGNRDAGGGEPA